MTYFNAKEIHNEYSFLDDCPEHLLDDIITLPIGKLSDRVQGICLWRQKLLNGELPPENVWPSKKISGPARLALEHLRIALFCRNNPELVDNLLVYILKSITKHHSQTQKDISLLAQQIEASSLPHRETSESNSTKFSPNNPAILNDDLRTQIWTTAEKEISERDFQADNALISAWIERVTAWTKIDEVFGDLGMLIGKGGLGKGILRHAGWHNMTRLNVLIENLPQIREIVRSLGRLQDTDSEECIAEQVFSPVRRLEEEVSEFRSPLVPDETRGIERSGDISRMLPVEAQMLGHPRMRLLWHAKRSERALFTYNIDGIQIEKSVIEREAHEITETRRPRQERGPIVAVIDTSGSMQGEPETIAKALVLEALRTAHSEKRDCYLYVYSGVGQIRTLELSVTQDGLKNLLDFLRFSFRGGTDIEVMSHVVNKLEQERWKKADVIVISDGEWRTPDMIINAVSEAKKKGTRFHGVQIGYNKRTGLHDICEPVHIFKDWKFSRYDKRYN